MKTCLICHQSLDESQFSYCRTGRRGLHPWCKPCVSAYNKSRYVPVDRKKILPFTPPQNLTQQRRAAPGYKAAQSVWYALAKKRRLPKWLTIDDVLPLYVLASKWGLTVDHIVPLNGKNISGLHVPWNLQLMSRSENSRKGNKCS